MFSFDEFDERAVRVFDEGYRGSTGSECVWFIGDCNVVFAEGFDGFLHVFYVEREVVEQSVFVVWLQELFLFSVIG